MSGASDSTNYRGEINELLMKHNPHRYEFHSEPADHSAVKRPDHQPQFTYRAWLSVEGDRDEAATKTVNTGARTQTIALAAVGEPCTTKKAAERSACAALYSVLRRARVLDRGGGGGDGGAACPVSAVAAAASATASAPVVVTGSASSRVIVPPAAPSAPGIVKVYFEDW